jgi:integrase/recombinase XerD
MLVQLFPRMHRRYSSLRLLGPILGGFAGCLHARGYPRVAVRRHLRAARRLEQRWLRRGLCSLSAICRTDFQVCAPGHSQDDPDLAAVACVLKTYFEERGLLAGEPAPEAPHALTGYQQYLTALRGLAPGTIADHLATVSEFLQFIADKRPAISLGQLTPRELEAFVQQVAARVSRATLQHVVAHLRSFLRWLAAQGAVRKGLESQIDTPRVYRQEQLPRALQWDTVRALLKSIDRSTAIGRRDYAMGLLIATYGLRSSEIVALTLDDFAWRAGRIARTAPQGRWRAHAAADGRCRQRRAGLYAARASDAADTRALPPSASASRPLETDGGDRGLPDAGAAQWADHSVSGSALLATFPGGAVAA